MANERKASKFETRLAFAGVGVIAVSLISMVATLVGYGLGVPAMPAIFAQIPLIGFPIGFLIILSLLLSAIIRRGRESK
jgi:hypothetical protein